MAGGPGHTNAAAISPWLGLEGAGTWRTDAGGGGVIGLAGGLRVHRLARLVFAAEWAPTTSIEALGTDRRMQGFSVLGGGEIAPTSTPAVRLSLGAGAVYREYTQDGQGSVGGTWIPQAAAGMGIAFAVLPWISVVPMAEARVDLQATEFEVDGASRGSLDPFEVRGGLRVEVAPVAR
jgi:hypothetical protein